jgi:hypothetical protein
MGKMAFVYGTPLHQTAMATCKAWSAELTKTFGKRAGDARYRPEGRGEEGTTLRAAYEANTKASMAWAEECSANQKRA